MGIDCLPGRSAELNLVFRPYLEISTSRHRRGDYTTSSRDVEYVFNLEQERHRCLL